MRWSVGIGISRRGRFLQLRDCLQGSHLCEDAGCGMYYSGLILRRIALVRGWENMPASSQEYRSTSGQNYIRRAWEILAEMVCRMASEFAPKSQVAHGDYHIGG